MDERFPARCIRPALAEAVRALLERGGLESGLDPQRGFDHGTFTLMHTMYPAADTWLNTTLVNSSPDERQQRLLRWQVAPAARLAHPREDHLMPLMVAVGAARNDAGVRVYHQTDFMDSITASSYRFGAPVIAGGR